MVKKLSFSVTMHCELSLGRIVSHTMEVRPSANVSIRCVRLFVILVITWQTYETLNPLLS